MINFVCFYNLVQEHYIRSEMDPFNSSGLIVESFDIDENGKVVEKDLFGKEAENYVHNEAKQLVINERLILQRYLEYESIDGDDEYNYEKEHDRFCKTKFSFESATFYNQASPLKPGDDQAKFSNYVLNKWTISKQTSDTKLFGDIVQYLDQITGQDISDLLKFCNPGGTEPFDYSVSQDGKHLYLFNRSD